MAAVESTRTFDVESSGEEERVDRAGLEPLAMSELFRGAPTSSEPSRRASRERERGDEA